VDNLTASQRRRCMQSVRRTRTRDEARVAACLDAMRLSYAWGTTRLPGTPDFVLRRRTAVFVHGCFWHGHVGCARARLPRTRRAFWAAKIARNRVRDRAAAGALRRRGYAVVTLWGCRLSAKAAVTAAIRRAVSKPPASARGARARGED
jgi:DNA mismatch endonuclease, patch repair protein